MTTITVTIYEDDDVEATYELPARWEICSHCRGDGKTSAYLGAFSREDFDADPDFAEDYVSGVYDRPCDDCGGTGRVLVIDEDALSTRQRRVFLAYRQQERERAEIDAMERAERAFGA